MKRLLLGILFALSMGLPAQAAAKLPFVDDFSVLLGALEPQPKTYVLYQNYPNPFNPSTVIKFELKAKQFVKLKIYNVLGKEVATLKEETLDANVYEVKFNAGHLQSGVYFYSLETNSGRIMRQMLLLK